MDYEQKFLKRFWKLVDKNANGCWLWTGAYGGGHYGVIWHNIKRTKLSVHRLSYEMHHGPITEGFEVCHSCDTALCVNPAHLWQGTHADNMADRDHKGRNTGVRHERFIRHGKFSDEQIRAIRSDTRKVKDIATDYPVTPVMISLIRSRKVYVHVT